VGWYLYPLTVLAGMAAGFINVLAGSGSLITLPLLIFIGLPANIANATNRIGVLLQNVVGVSGFYRRGKLDVRGSLLLAAARDTQGLFGSLAKSLELPIELVKLDAAVVFAPAQPNYDIDMREWVTFARAAEADRDDGLVFVDAPMTEVIR
jgi:uncharacterized membrane protein YfcA